MEAPIIRTCSLALAFAALALPAPATAQQQPPSTIRIAPDWGPQDKSVLRYVNARTADLLGEEQRAADLYAQLVADGGASRQVEAQAASNAIAAGRFDLAMDIARQSEAPNQLNLDVRLLLLAESLTKRQYRAALEMLGDEDARVPMTFLAPFVRSWIDVATHRAGTDPRGPTRVANMARSRPLSRQIDEQAALLYLASGQVDEALPLIDKALMASGGRATRLRLAFAENLYELGRPDVGRSLVAGEDEILSAARSRLEKGERIGMAIRTPAEGLSELLLAVAIDLTQAGNSDLPLLIAQVARFADPANEGADIVTGALLDRVDRHGEAQSLYATVPSDSPLEIQAKDSLVQSLIADDRAAEALALLDLWSEDNAELVGQYGRRADALSALERHAEAADAYARQRGAASQDDWTLLFLEGAARDQAGQWDAAKQLFHAALAIAPDQALVLNYLGYNMLERGEDIPRASAYIRKASALEPDNAAITDSLGWALYKTGDLDGALDALERAAKQAPDDPEIHEHYGDALYAAGRRIEARFAWEAASTFAEKEETARRIDDKLAFGLSEANAAP